MLHVINGPKNNNWTIKYNSSVLDEYKQLYS